MRTRTWVLTGIGCLAVLLLSCVAATIIYSVAGERVKREVRKLAPGIPLVSNKSGDIFGSYQLVSESGGWRPLATARVILKFVPPSTLALRATKPGETLTDLGTFVVSGKTIKLDLPELGKQAEGKFSYDGEELILPFQLFSDGPGTSKWKRVSTEPDPMRDAVEGFYERAAKEGREAGLRAMLSDLRANPAVSEAKVCGAATVLVTYKGGYQEFFLAPPEAGRAAHGGGGSSPHLGGDFRRPERVPGVTVVIQRAQFMPMGTGGGMRPPTAGGGSGEAAWLSYEPEPVSHGDAPAERTALILAAFHTLPVLIPGSNGVHYWTFASKGEDLGPIQEDLRHAKVEVSATYVDQAVTVKLLYEKLKDKRWGVFFFSTHGGTLEDDAILSTGEEIPLQFSLTPATREEFLERYFREYLERSVGGSIGQAEYLLLKDDIIAGWIDTDLPFVAVKSRFFRDIGADFSSSLVYLSACESAKTNYFRDAMRPRSYAGWKDEVDMELGADMNKEFFRCLSRRTRSDREAWEFGVRTCLGKKWDQKFRSAGDTEKPLVDARNFVLYRQNQGEPVKYLTQEQVMMIQAVRRQVCTYKGGKGMADTVESLYKYDPNESAINPQFFYKSAFNRQDVPKWMIDEVKGELCGYGGSPARFTLEEE